MKKKSEAVKSHHEKYFTVQTERAVGEAFKESIAPTGAKLYICASRVLKHFMGLPEDQQKAILAGLA